MKHHERQRLLEALYAPASLEELDRLWENPDLTIVGVAEAWSKFHGCPIKPKQLQSFVMSRRDRYPDRRRFNGGVEGYSNHTAREWAKSNPVDLYGARDLVVAGTSPEEAARRAGVPLAALKRFMN